MMNLMYLALLGKKAVAGQIEYTSPGAHTFVVPHRVRTVSVMLIGGAGGKSIYVDGSFGDEYHAFTGQGGGCVWKNNISVTPGQSIAVVVGAEGAQKTAVFPDSFTANNGGVSYFSSVAYLRAHGGEGGSGISGAYGDGGGYGGTVHTGGSGTSG
jgi:hypothetical protein